MFRLTLVQLEGVKSTLYGGIFTVIMVLLRPVAQKVPEVKLFSLYYSKQK